MNPVVSTSSTSVRNKARATCRLVISRSAGGTPISSCGGTELRGSYIDFISSYCDSWCERCAFTGRCSHYAIKVATAMCDGDVAVALELAVGTPPPKDDAERQQRQAFSELFENCEPAKEDMEQF